MAAVRKCYIDLSKRAWIDRNGKSLAIPAQTARRLEIDQGLYDDRAGTSVVQRELRIRSFGGCGVGVPSVWFLPMARGGSIRRRSTARRAPPVSFSAQNGPNCCGDGLIQGRRMGRYIDEILQPGERVLYSTNEHWMFFLPAIAAWIVPVAFLVLSRMVAADALIWVCVALAAVAGLAALYWTATAWFHRWTTETDVTNMRVVHKTGFIKRRTFEMSLDKVESVDVNQSILGRLMNYGDLTVLGVGEGKKAIKTIAAPLAFRNFITAR